VAVLIYIRWAQLPLLAVADCLAAPVALGMAAEQLRRAAGWQRFWRAKYVHFSTGCGDLFQ
jgi:hypothetical protein